MVFCVDLSRRRWPSQEVRTWLLLKYPGMPCRQEKGRMKEGFCHQVPHHDRLEVSAIRSLTTDCMLTDFPGPATWDLLLPPGLTLWLLPGPTWFLHPLVAQDQPRCSWPLALDHQNVVQRDYCWIPVVTIPALHNSCFFLLLSKAIDLGFRFELQN